MVLLDDQKIILDYDWIKQWDLLEKDNDHLGKWSLNKVIEQSYTWIRKNSE